ncbi:MAG: hypothetical protein NZL91_07270 [Thermoflexales bacterium]|nr:hypothetical protein [Thermoflexales bacterium]MCS7323873.1 hypothetical protein [Thermoflexales bacterium]MCX7938371.1 hypothetical protein [Thermoflexales bacterium]MDW8052987.1 hypothetical protein [Anaerolineae bacterium]MDW8291640.1 hypothetical protein [Anaerolineae bacterium]
MGLIQIHANLATAVMLFNALVGAWGLIKYLRGEGMDGSYFGAVALSPLLGLVQAVVGLMLVAQGLGGIVRAVHYLYGVLVVLAVPATFAYTRGRDDRGALLLYSVVLLVNALFGSRAVETARYAAF